MARRRDRPRPIVATADFQAARPMSRACGEPARAIRAVARSLAMHGPLASKWQCQRCRKHADERKEYYFIRLAPLAAASPDLSLRQAYTMMTGAYRH